MTKEEQQQETRKRLEQKKSEQRLRVFRLANAIIMRPEGRDPYTLDAIALELRSLAFQLRATDKALEALALTEENND